MIPTRTRDNRKMKPLKLSKNLERKVKDFKCRECTVVVTPMDFARILGKFTKVKIQYESSSNPKQTAATPKSRIKAKENGMVHRNVYKSVPAPKSQEIKKTSKSNALSTSTSNVLRENNRLKKPEFTVAVEYRDKPQLKSKVRYYGVVFDQPTIKKTEVQNKIVLQDLLTSINKDILPAKDWNMVFLPQNAEPKNDKIYDRIAAELEDLMYNEKTKNGSDVKENKSDEFPSILDILNENTKDTKTIDNSVNLESSDVEAMLLGTCPSVDPEPMEVDNQASSNEPAVKASTVEDNPESPSILEEPLQSDATPTKVSKVSCEADNIKDDPPTLSIPVKDAMVENDNTNTNKYSRNGVTQIIFKKSVNGTCCKSVTCPKNLKYNISIGGKHVELLGAPKLISSLEDLQVLLQIVEESELNNLYVLQ